MENVPSLQHSSLVHDRGGPAVFFPHSHRQMKHFAYVDNLGVLSANREAVEEGLQTCQTTSRRRTFCCTQVSFNTTPSKPWVSS